jgi:2-polyprenyl-6-hydroxyphenyl methylase/3-demethylubiquinone-9 3-methyltransferase
VEALALYRGLPASVRLHARIRSWTCPLPRVVERAPREGRLLEVGCGHGLFANAAALSRPGLDVLGVDPDPGKIRWAQATVGSRPNVRFRTALLAEVDERGFDAVAAVDVLYLVPRAEWASFLAGLRDRLRPGGRLLLKDVEPRPRWKFYRCLAQETVSVRLLGITHGGAFSFADRREMESLLRDAGFEGTAVTVLARGYLTPHVLYEAARR